MRRRRPEKRKILPDPVYNDLQIAKFVNYLMKRGKKGVAEKIFYGSIAEYADNNLSLIPDFISNCGMARVFAYLMEKRHIELTDTAIFTDCSNIIYNALLDCYNHSSNKLNIAASALEIALKKLLTK